MTHQLEITVQSIDRKMQGDPDWASAGASAGGIPTSANDNASWEAPSSRIKNNVQQPRYGAIVLAVIGKMVRKMKLYLEGINKIPV